MNKENERANEEDARNEIIEKKGGGGQGGNENKLVYDANKGKILNEFNYDLLLD